MTHFKKFLLASLFAAAPAVGFAADLETSPAPAPAGGWLVTIGLGPEALTSFPGAKTYRVWPTGTLAWRGPNEPPPFSAPDDGFGVALLDLGWLKAGPVGRVLPRRGLSNGNGNFYGLANVNWTLELGGFVEGWISEHLRTRLEVRQGVNGHDGLDANVSIDAIERIGPYTLSLGPRLQLGNTRFMSAYFSVTPAEAFANGNVYPYQAYGGVESFGGLAAIKYDITPSWSVTGFGGYNRLMNSAAESPIPNRLGSLNEFAGGVIVAYSFNFGGF
ncbi:MipA/OmpV family protein [Methylocapsa acidiphila]|uniref:MipA/OmpV family protein n=1 Tax=Methylocapsa acidiphila TaxID=133552 RepID=UPI00042A1E76|nr:MipA/OmpV family protein [Methylocapsa acidiphila]